MNLNGEFETQDTQGQDLIVNTEPDFPVNQDNQIVAQTEPDIEQEVVIPVEANEEDIITEIPGVNEDLSGIAAMEEAFRDLEYVSQDIAQAGGICQVIATEADKCIPGFLSENRPLGFYTKTPTATNLKYALEEISAKKAGIITAIIAAILAAFYKIFQWFTKKQEDGGGPLGGKSKKDLNEEIEANKTDSKAFAEKVKDVDSNVKGGIDKLMKDVAANGFKSTIKLVTEVDGLTVDITSKDSKLLKKVKSIFTENGGKRGLASLLYYISDALKSLESIAQKQIGSYKVSDQIEADAGIKKIKDGVHPAVSEILNTISYEGHYVQVSEIKKELNELIHTLRNERHKPTSYVQLALGVAEVSHSSLAKDFTDLNDVYVELLKDILPRLETIQKVVSTGSIEKDDEIISSPYYKGRAELVRAVNQLNNIVKDLAEIITQCYNILIKLPRQCISRLMESHKEAERYLKDLKKEYEENGRAETHKEEINRIEEYLNSLEQ